MPVRPPVQVGAFYPDITFHIHGFGWDIPSQGYFLPLIKRPKAQGEYCEGGLQRVGHGSDKRHRVKEGRQAYDELERSETSTLNSNIDLL